MRPAKEMFHHELLEEVERLRAERVRGLDPRLAAMLARSAVNRGLRAIASLRSALDVAERSLNEGCSPGAEVRNMGQNVADLAQAAGVLDALADTKESES